MNEESADSMDEPFDLPRGRRETEDGEGESSSESEDDGVSEGSLKVEEGEPEFFDPSLDDVDAAWVAKQRQGRKSDAILSCPCCLTTLCIDCQQHAELEGQFRAMFVMNCRVALDKVLKVTSGERRRKRNRNSSACDEADAGAGAGEGLFHAVECEVCDTQVGARDEEEVYHFFHVVATNA